MYQKPTRCQSLLLIKNIHQFLIVVLVAVVLVTAATVPKRVIAFWPFYSDADASTGAFIPASGTPALKAPTNIDPDPNKGLADIPPTSGGALIAYSGPSGTTADVIGTTQSDTISVYVVRPGDTLSDIARMYNVSVNTIIWANDIQGRTVHPGDTLVILPISGVEHTVVKGNTLQSIAKKYGGDVDEIAQFNGLDVDVPLEVGSTVIVPGGEITPVPVKQPARPSAPLYASGGSASPGYYGNPVPGAIVTQGIHGRNGIDLGAARGTPIYAAADGLVIVARNNGAWNGGYGNYVVITHSNGSQTLYSHMRSTIVAPGQSVARGQLIGYVGATGKATGAHLHFEVRGAANPFRFCSAGTVCSPQ